jgi:hypothetical protein
MIQIVEIFFNRYTLVSFLPCNNLKMNYLNGYIDL